MFLLVLIRLVVRKQWLAIAGTYLVFLLLALGSVTNLAIELPLAMVAEALILIVLIRFGLLAYSAMLLVASVNNSSILTLDFSVWYAGRSMLLPLLAAALFAYALSVSLGRRRAEL